MHPHQITPCVFGGRIRQDQGTQRPIFGLIKLDDILLEIKMEYSMENRPPGPRDLGGFGRKWTSRS